MAQRRAWLPPRGGGYSATEQQPGKPQAKSDTKPSPPKGRAGVSKPDKARTVSARA